jgi:hypothetical protein
MMISIDIEIRKLTPGLTEEYVAPDCRGPLAMYEKCGFSICAEQEGRVAIRKALKQ